MDYLAIYAVVFFVIGTRAFQQKVIATNHYPAMGVVGSLIYLGEGTSILMVAHGGWTYVIAGALGAGTGVITAVYIFNQYFTSIFKKNTKESRTNG